VTNKVQYVLLPPTAIEKPLDMAQQISGSYGNQDMVMDAWVQADDQGITLALLSSMGSSLGELSFSEGALSFVSSLFPPSLRVEYVVADFQFCFYRIDALKPALGKLRLTVEIQDGPGGAREVRRILDGKKLIIEIEKAPEAVHYTNYLRNYRYTLRGDFS
jgi:hypothetical protein